MTRLAELRELVRHRTLAFVRMPEAVFWTFAFPVILAAVLGYAFRSGEPAPSLVAVLETSADAPLVERLAAEPRVELVRFADREAAERALRVGKVDALVVDPDATPPHVRLDPTRAEAELARLRVLVASTADAAAAELELEPVREHGSRYVDFLFPGLIGMNLMGTGLWSIGFAIAEMRQRRVLRRLLVTPMRRSSFLLSFLISRLVFLAAEVAVLLTFGLWALDVPLRAGLVSFALLILLGAAAFSSLGLLAAARVRTIEGISGLLNLVMLPMWLGSGVFFSYERFPELVQPVLRALPLTALVDALRATMLEGASLAGVAPELAILVAWLVLPFALALRVFRWS